MESWIIQKEAIVRTEEKGANKDRVESMQKKFDVSTNKHDMCIPYMCTSVYIQYCTHVKVLYTDVFLSTYWTLAHMSYIAFFPQNFVTDLVANSKRMSEINNKCDQLIKSNHMQSVVIKRRQNQLNEL